MPKKHTTPKNLPNSRTRTPEHEIQRTISVDLEKTQLKTDRRHILYEKESHRSRLNQEIVFCSVQIS